MKRKVIFKKLVDGYKTQVKWKLDDKSTFKSMTFPKEPLEIKGEVLIKEPEKKVDMEYLEGITIPEFDTKKVSKFGIKYEEENNLFSTTYSLIPEVPDKNEPIMAYAKIELNPNENLYNYTVVQPQISQKMKRLIVKLKDILEEKMDVDFNKLKKKGTKDYLKTQTMKLIDYFGIKLSEIEKEILNYYIERDFLGLGLIEPLMYDPNIEDISCDGVNIPVYIFHRNPILGSIKTNIVFSDREVLDSFLIKLAQLCGQSISILDPLLQGTLPDGSRIQGTLETDIARRGSNFTIRKFAKDPITTTHLLNYKTIDIKTLAFLWLAVDYGCSVLVSGGTATGKTSFLNVLSSFIKSNMKIVSIEDTAELKLFHPHWIPHVARTSISTDAGKEMGEVDLFDLLRESMRQRPDYIILGEVRGREAYVLFQQMATGHPSFATIHADSMEKLIDRLTTPPIDLSSSSMQSLDLIVFLAKLRYKGKFTRKVQSIYEITSFDREKNTPIINQIFKWNADFDSIEIKNSSVTLKKILIKSGLTEEELIEELKRRMIILYWLQERNIIDLKSVSEIINLYYSYPDKIMNIISEEI